MLSFLFKLSFLTDSVISTSFLGTYVWHPTVCFISLDRSGYDYTMQFIGCDSIQTYSSVSYDNDDLCLTMSYANVQ